MGWPPTGGRRQGGAVSKGKVIGAIVVLVVVVGAVLAVSFLSGGSDAEVTTAQAERRDLAITVTASGRVESGTRADVFPPTAGILATLDVVDGERVVAGQTLASMDTATLDLAVTQAEAALAAAEAQLAGISEQAPSSAEIAAARASRDLAYAGYQAAASQADTVRAPTQQELDAAANATAAAKVLYDAADDAYEALLESIEATTTPPAGSDTLLLAARLLRDQANADYLEAQTLEQSLITFDEETARGLAQAEVDQANIAYLTADAAYERLQGVDLGPQRRAAQAGVDQAIAALAFAQDNRDSATLTAPIDGVVLFNSIGVPVADGVTPKPEVGAAVGPQAAPFTVVDFTALAFVADVDEVDVGRVAVGMEARIRLDAFPDSEIETTVDRVQPTAQLTFTGATVYPVRLTLPEFDGVVLIGMRGDARVEVQMIDDVIVVPIEAIFDEDGSAFVYVVEGGRLRKEEVIVGTLTETDASIASGLSEGEVVATSGTVDLADDLTVTVR